MEDAGDDDATENLNSLFVTFQNPAVNIHGVADFECELFFAKTALFNLFEKFVSHC